jgi:subtilisin family serine protease
VAGPALASIPYPPNDPYFSSQWGLKVIKAPQAWTVSTGAGVVVAVIDTGVQFGIPELPPSKSAGSYSCVGAGASSNPCPAVGAGDDQGHGTWVASIIASGANDGNGIAGVAPDARILSIKAIGADGTGSVEDISKGIKFAADQGAQVINLSVGPDAFGKPFPTLDCPPSTIGGCLTPPVNDSSSLHKALQPAVDYAAAHGALVVVAAGNTDPGAGPGPSLYLGMNNVLIVGATGPNDEAASYSDTGSGSTFIYAPGGNGACSSGSTTSCIIVASRSGNYQVSEGTSFATPHAAAVAALLMATGYSNSSAENQIISSADHVQAGARLNAAAALGASSAALPGPAAPPPVAVAPAGVQPPAAQQPPARPAAAKPAAPKPAAPKPAAPPASPTPTPSPSPSPAASVTADPSPQPSPVMAPANLSPKPRPTLASRMLTTGRPLQSLALVLFLSTSGAAGIVWLARRVRV